MKSKYNIWFSFSEFALINILFMFRQRMPYHVYPISYAEISEPAERIRIQFWVPKLYPYTARGGNKDLCTPCLPAAPAGPKSISAGSLPLWHHSLRNKTTGGINVDYPGLLLQWFLNPWGMWPRLHRCCHPRLRISARTWSLHQDINGSWYPTVPKPLYLLRLPQNRNQWRRAPKWRWHKLQ